ncbi:hypothetical protein THAOC_11900, partial [Thalassiosira oceanica]
GAGGVDKVDKQPGGPDKNRIAGNNAGTKEGTGEDWVMKNNLQGSSLASPYFTPVGHTMARKPVMSYDFNEDDTNSDEDDESDGELDHPVINYDSSKEESESLMLSTVSEARRPPLYPPPSNPTALASKIPVLCQVSNSSTSPSIQPSRFLAASNEAKGH